MNAIKFKSMMPSPWKTRGRCPSTVIKIKYFRRSTGNLYHNDSYEMSAKRRKLSVVNEPTVQNRKTHPVLIDMHKSKMDIFESTDFITWKRGGIRESNILIVFYVVASGNRFTNSSSKLVVDMNRTPIIINWQNTLPLITFSATSNTLEKKKTFPGWRWWNLNWHLNLTLWPDCAIWLLQSEPLSTGPHSQVGDSRRPSHSCSRISTQNVRERYWRTIPWSAYV